MLTREPAIVIGALGAILKAVVPVLILGEIVQWSDKMTAAVMFLIDVTVASAATVFIRSQTVTNDTANEQIKTALKLPPGTPVNEVIEKVANQ